MLRRVFNEVGYLINEFIPEMYHCEFFQENKSNILSISMPLCLYPGEDYFGMKINANEINEINEKILDEISQELSEYKNLKWLKLEDFNFDISRLKLSKKIKTLILDTFNQSLEPLKNLNLEEISLKSCTHSLELLRGIDIKKLYVSPLSAKKFESLRGLNPGTGLEIGLETLIGTLSSLEYLGLHNSIRSLSVLKGMNIGTLDLRTLSLRSCDTLTELTDVKINEIIAPFYRNNLEPFRGMGLKSITVGSDDNLEPLKDEPIEKIIMEQFTGWHGDLPLRGLPIRIIMMDQFNGSLEPLRGAPIEYISMDQFDDDLSGLSESPVKIIRMNEYNGSLSHISDLFLERIEMNSYNQDDVPLNSQLLMHIVMNSHKGNIMQLKTNSLKTIEMNQFNNDLEPLCKATSHVREIRMNSYDGLLDSLKFMQKLRTLCMDSFNGYWNL